MPYTAPPTRIKALPAHAQDIWTAAFNSAYKQYGGDEAKVNATAWAAVERAGYAKKGDKWVLTKNGEGPTTASSLDPAGVTVDASCSGKQSKKTKRSMKMKKMSKFAKWTTKEKSSLPDSAFAVVEGSGDTKVRKLPYKDANGKIDVPHLRNALVRVAQGKTDLSPSQRAKAMSTLKKVAKKYLKTYETKSGEIMHTYISKFQANIVDKLATIIDTLKRQIDGKQPTDKIEFEAKSMTLLIQDMEEVIEVEKQRELDEVPVQVAVPPIVAPVVDLVQEPVAPAEIKQQEIVTPNFEEESKFQELLSVCEGYKTELEKANGIIGQYESKFKSLEEANKTISTELSKFKEDSFHRTLNDTLAKVSKFKNLNTTDALNLKKTWLESKMSETAIAEIGRNTDVQIMSKLSEPKETTKSSVMLDPVNGAAVEFSKLSADDKLEVLAQMNAKRRGGLR
jgi:cation transport regulator